MNSEAEQHRRSMFLMPPVGGRVNVSSLGLTGGGVGPGPVGEVQTTEQVLMFSSDTGLLF